jgi:arsenate reductase
MPGGPDCRNEGPFMALTVYGLKNCDSCKLALKEMGEAGLGPRFVDIRAEADLMALVPVWVKLAGAEDLLNTRSTTWRGLSIQNRQLAASEPAAVMNANPTLIKRPVIDRDGAILVGWAAATRAAILGAAA